MYSIHQGFSSSKKKQLQLWQNNSCASSPTKQLTKQPSEILLPAVPATSQGFPLHQPSSHCKVQTVSRKLPSFHLATRTVPVQSHEAGLNCCFLGSRLYRSLVVKVVHKSGSEPTIVETWPQLGSKVLTLKFVGFLTRHTIFCGPFGSIALATWYVSLPVSFSVIHHGQSCWKRLFSLMITICNA